ncbi:hypothetical protein FEM48_Zijuj03G0015600 [Ziziphus jujuba var. spinosa]|uniref:Sulfotransferase n=1 Tax=Ziziphus jujuba var. spinosa TaxID=714518 RepID=A0A978VMD9_ZIZJJ|nr:hypothetical protein FEM48_Zijuj03G0015600 [Ziziphus jujuba var. spinosa]
MVRQSVPLPGFLVPIKNHSRHSFFPKTLPTLQAHDQDILLASMPKSGITWLKALVFSIVNRAKYDPSTSHLLASNSHELVPFVEFTLYDKNKIPELSDIPSPRLFSTHFPYASLPESIKPGEGRLKWTMEEYGEKFCEGEVGFGPFWNHVLGYWKERLERQEKVLFLKNKRYFRKGEVGDWVNHPSQSTEEQLNKALHNIKAVENAKPSWKSLPAGIPERFSCRGLIRCKRRQMEGRSSGLNNYVVMDNIVDPVGQVQSPPKEEIRDDGDRLVRMGLEPLDDGVLELGESGQDCERVVLY